MLRTLAATVAALTIALLGVCRLTGPLLTKMLDADYRQGLSLCVLDRPRAIRTAQSLSNLSGIWVKYCSGSAAAKPCELFGGNGYG
jgi:hypothetical protein